MLAAASYYERAIDRTRARVAAASFFERDVFLNLNNQRKWHICRPFYSTLLSYVLACFDHSLYYYTSNQTILLSQSSSLSLRITVSSLLFLSLRTIVLVLLRTCSFLSLSLLLFFLSFFLLLSPLFYLLTPFHYYLRYNLL